MNAQQGTNVYQWANDYGEIRWQPQLDNGKRLWKEYEYIYERVDVWGDKDRGFGPVLYRSKKRAEEVAQKYQRKMKHRAMSTFSPVGEDHE